MDEIICKKMIKNDKESIVELKSKEINLDKLQGEINKILYQVNEDIIVGEIISFRMSDINAYITVKSKDRQIKCIFWKIAHELKFAEYLNLKDGDKIKIKGKLNIMKKDLSIYFNIKDIEKDGVGNYMNIYQEYRKKIIDLEWDKNKIEMTLIPLKIGIITSLEGAAIEDILKTFENDDFKGTIIIKNAVVQGRMCSDSVIEGINYFEKNHSNVDILMITRGGGSYEDLVGFSSWDLIEKVKNTKIITISAVGHQIDNQLIDEVSDYKCATPSIGAKLIIERQKEFINKINDHKEIIDSVIEKYKENKIYFKKIEENYDNIIKRFEIKEMNDKYNKYYKIYKKIVDDFNESKMSFIEKASHMKPSILRGENELFSLNDFVNVDDNKTIKPKEVTIRFIDGYMNISYKITEYKLLIKN